MAETQIWFGTRAVRFEGGGKTGPQHEVIDDNADFFTGTFPWGTFDTAGTEWLQFLAFSGDAAAREAIGIDLSDGVHTAATGAVNTTGDLRVGGGVTAQNLADLGGGGRLLDTTNTLDTADDAVAISGWGKANAAQLSGATLDSSETGNRVVFSNENGFGFITGSGFDPGGNALRLNDGDAINFEIRLDRVLTAASFTVKVLGSGSTHVVLDSDGATIRDTNGASNLGFVQDASAGELDLGLLAHGTAVAIDYLAQTILINGGAFIGDASAFFAEFAADGQNDLTLGSLLGNAIGWSVDDLVLSTDATPVAAPLILGFDDIAVAPELPMPAGYGGFAWSQAGIFDVTGYGGALGYRASSGNQIAFIGEATGDFEVPGYDAPAGSPLVISRADTDFSVLGAAFSSATIDGLTVTATAYDDGALVGTHSFAVPTGATGIVDFSGIAGERFDSIDELRLSASNYFGFDDFTYLLG